MEEEPQLLTTPYFWLLMNKGIVGQLWYDIVFPIVCLPSIVGYIIPNHLANIRNSSEKKNEKKMSF